MLLQRVQVEVERQQLQQEHKLAHATANVSISTSKITSELLMPDRRKQRLMQVVTKEWCIVFAHVTSYRKTMIKPAAPSCLECLLGTALWTSRMHVHSKSVDGFSYHVRQHMCDVLIQKWYHRSH